jgi:hypothetical protein
VPQPTRGRQQPIVFDVALRHQQGAGEFRAHHRLAKFLNPFITPDTANEGNDEGVVMHA